MIDHMKHYFHDSKMLQLEEINVPDMNGEDETNVARMKKKRMEEKKVYEPIFSFTLTNFLFLIFLLSFERVLLFVFLVLSLGDINMRGKRVTLHELWWK